MGYSKYFFPHLPRGCYNQPLPVIYLAIFSPALPQSTHFSAPRLCHTVHFRK
jgi:hypothetical protein